MRTRRDFLEAVLYPSAAFARAYETCPPTLKRVRMPKALSKVTIAITSVSSTPPVSRGSSPPPTCKAFPLLLYRLCPRPRKPLAGSELADLLAYLQSLR